jgi:ATP-dependent Lhr-like helicase
MTETELSSATLSQLFDALHQQGRVCRVLATESTPGVFLSAEMLPAWRKIFPHSVCEREPALPDSLIAPDEHDEAVKAFVRRRLDVCGPVTAQKIAEQSGMSISQIDLALLALEREGFVFRGRFTQENIARSDVVTLEWCERRLLQRIHRYTLDAHREAIKPVSLQSYTLYLFELHELRTQTLKPKPVALPSAAEAQALLQRTMDRLDGMSAPAAAWEGEILPSRLSFYDPAWLDLLCVSGRLGWGRFSSPAQISAVRTGSKRSGGPIKTTPITVSSRVHMDIWQQLASPVQSITPDLSANADRVLADLKNRGASFFSEIRQRTGLLPVQLEQALSELVASGLLTSDGFTGLRALLTPEARKPSLSSAAQNPIKKSAGASPGRQRSRRTGYSVAEAGRWSLLYKPEPAALDEQAMETLLSIYLQRWGVISRQILAREVASPAWRELLPVLRRQELRGILRGGRFIEGLGGEQFTLPENVAPLREAAKKLAEQRTQLSCTGESEQEKFISEFYSARYCSLSAVDPVNNLPLLLPDIKLTKTTRNRLLYKDGVPIALLDNEQVRFLREVPAELQWSLEQLLRRHDVNPRVRSYLA